MTDAAILLKHVKTNEKNKELDPGIFLLSKRHIFPFCDVRGEKNTFNITLYAKRTNKMALKHSFAVCENRL